MADMIELARQYGSYGYRRVAVLLREAGWQISDGRIERLWRRERGGSGNGPRGRFPDKPESATKTSEEREVVAERRIVRAVASRISQPRLVV